MAAMEARTGASLVGVGDLQVAAGEQAGLLCRACAIVAGRTRSGTSSEM
jgi:hypothetical protein